MVLSANLMPTEIYISFVEELIKEYYDGNQRVYWVFGRNAAKTTLGEKGLLNVYIRRKRSPKDFISSILARIWTNYFDEGRESFELEGNVVHARVLDLPNYHPIYEFTIMGYTENALEIVGINVKEIKKIKSSAKEIYYQFVVDL